jgi:aspartyl/asparaginyl beta-hydroxylase (cupin superfamily)
MAAACEGRGQVTISGIDQREADADRAAAARDLVTAERLLAAAAADAPANIGLWLKLASVRHAQGNLQGALAAVSRALANNPLAFMPLMMKATLLEHLGQHDAADEIYAAALFHAPPAERLTPMIQAQIDHARSRQTAAVARKAAILDRALASVPAPACESEAQAIARFRDNTLRTNRAWHQEPTHFHFPGLPEIEFFDRAVFPFLADLDAATDAIRSEFEALIASEKGELVPYVQYPDEVPGQMPLLNKSRDWTAIHLLAMGERVEANARHCPQTLKLFESIDQPHIPGRSPNLMFSLLAPHTRIPPHTGVSNARLVLHLPLIVPENCGFRCGGETREWVPGKAFVFDDTIEHEAWNDSDKLRVVLIGDLWRPELTPAQRAAVTAIVAAEAAPGML